MKFGLEVEFFVKSRAGIADASLCGLPHDSYPLLAEARGQPSTSVFEAVASVRGEIERILDMMRPKKLTPLFINWLEKTPEVMALDEAALRRGFHKQIRWENLYGLSASSMNDKHLAAGLHVTVSDTKDIKDAEGDHHLVHKLIDFPKMFGRITKEFEKEMADAGRNPGFYEVKYDGLVEYRSLPATLIRSRDFASRLNACLTAA